MITECLISIMFALHFQIFEFCRGLIHYKTISSYYVIEGIKTSNNNQLIRLLTFNLFHNSLNHLLINMIAFINYGITLEDFFNYYNKYLYFKILLFLMISSGILNVLFHYITYLVTQDIKYYQVQSCGFSAVLFGLQFIFYYLLQNDFKLAFQRVFVHLVYIFLMIPGTSTFGHLAGLSSGMLVVKLFNL